MHAQLKLPLEIIIKYFFINILFIWSYVFDQLEAKQGVRFYMCPGPSFKNTPTFDYYWPLICMQTDMVYK